jgi:hypothetical protein
MPGIPATRFEIHASKCFNADDCEGVIEENNNNPKTVKRKFCPVIKCYTNR